jgi:hypothetical protein
MLGWQDRVGAIEPEKYTDLFPSPEIQSPTTLRSIDPVLTTTFIMSRNGPALNMDGRAVHVIGSL